MPKKKRKWKRAKFNVGGLCRDRRFSQAYSKAGGKGKRTVKGLYDEEKDVPGPIKIIKPEEYDARNS